MAKRLSDYHSTTQLAVPDACKPLGASELSLVFEGDGLQPVRKQLAISAALAAEGLLFVQWKRNQRSFSCETLEFFYVTGAIRSPSHPSDKHSDLGLAF
jgi:hypothetical protein